MPRPKGITVQRVCPSCGESFDVPPKRAKSAKYCSPACVAIGNRRERAERSCEHCGTPFVVLTSALRHGPGRFCSKACSDAGQTAGIAERFWSKVDRTGGPDACWLWQGGDDGAGYGSFRMPDGPHRAHRVAFFLTYGRWRDEFLCHDCPGGDTPRCVNPAHVFEGDSAANNRDRANKGRSAVGSRHGKAKLTEDDVRAMRVRHLSGKVTIADLAREYGVSHPVAWKAIHRHSWKHVA